MIKAGKLTTDKTKKILDDDKSDRPGNINLYNLIAIIIIICFFMSGILTLSEYGMSWDEGLGNMFFGERYLYYLTSFNYKYLDFKTELSINNTLPLNLFQSPFHDFPYEFPPLADIFSAASMHLFSYKLGWIDPVDGFHLFTILAASIMLLFFNVFVQKNVGRKTALFSLIFLATFPRFWSDMHFNPKDIPETVFICLTIISYIWWYKKPAVSKAILTGILFGSALAIKVNAIFVPLILLFGIMPWSFMINDWRLFFLHIKNYFLHYCLIAVSSVVLYFLSWPYLYDNPLRVKGYFDYILSQGGRAVNAEWSFQPIGMFLSTTPEIMLIFIFIGIFFTIRALRQDRTVFWKIILVWFFMPIIRVSLPGMHNFDGVRHFLEFLPAASILAGAGVVNLIKHLARDNTKKIIAYNIITVFLISLNIIWITHKFYPYQYLYYNDVSGGFTSAGVQFGQSETTDYWAVSYREGLEWLNTNADQNSYLFVPIARWVVDIPAPIWLREDIKLIPDSDQANVFNYDRPVYIMMITREEFYNEVAAFCQNELVPEYQITIENEPIMKIYKINPHGITQ